MKILIWGTGAMARALALGLKHAHQDFEFLCWNPTQEKAQSLARELSGKLWSAGDAFDVVILGFKPQKMPEVKLPDCSQATVLSLLAATSIDKVSTYIPARHYIRTMPNLAVEKNAGVLLWAQRNLNPEAQAFWQGTFSQLGLAPFLEDSAIDLYTVVSGCAPAYAFQWLKSAEDFILESGGDPALARELLRASLLGALDSVTTADDLSQRISQVTSKGGVTEAVLTAWKSQHESYMRDGLAAGLERMRELTRS